MYADGSTREVTEAFKDKGIIKDDGKGHNCLSLELFKYFIDIHIVLVGAYAKKYHRRCECVCICLFFALYEECMHTLYVRALPLRCRHTDVNMHAFASRKDLAAVFAPRLNPASQKAVLRAARQQVLKDVWPSE